MVAPLDWGLGHATRCIPIIHRLQRYDCIVVIAASGKVKKLLQTEFPTLSFFDLPGYGIAYSRSKRWLPFKILAQVPKILKIIRNERKWLAHLLNHQKIDAIISDNRYGLYTHKRPCVFITHQLCIKAGFVWLEKYLQRINYSYINRFTACWVPDIEGSLNLAGHLSHPPNLPSIPVAYLGILARFQTTITTTPAFKWLVILSGPEPQRSILERKLLLLSANSTDSFVIVRGLPGEEQLPAASLNCRVFNHLPTKAMEQALAASSFVISRCGYTTVMEMLALKKKAVFIPTPGQTEQEYLAEHLYKQGWCYRCIQDDDLPVQLEQAARFNYRLPDIADESLDAVVGQFVRSL